MATNRSFDEPMPPDGNPRLPSHRSYLLGSRAWPAWAVAPNLPGHPLADPEVLPGLPVQSVTKAAGRTRADRLGPFSFRGTTVSSARSLP